MSGVNDLNARFSKYVHEILVDAGWFEGREVSLNSIKLPIEYSLFPKAEVVLVEFGGLRIGEQRRGINFGADNITIQPFDGARNAPDFAKYEPVVQSKLYAVGYIGGRHCSVLIDEEGRVYYSNGYLIRRACNFDSALELILMGVRTDSKELAAGWGAGAELEIHLDNS